MSERMKILKLLEDGKINAEEAARLLEALSQSEKKERKKGFKIWSSIEKIPEVIASAVDLKNLESKETLNFSQKRKIEFKGISGDLKILGNAKDRIEIEKDGFAKIKEKEDKLEIKAISGDMKIVVPRDTNVEIKGVSGALEMANLNGKMNIASVSGDIKGNDLSGSFIGNFVSGDVDIDFLQIEQIKIQSRSGDIIVRLDENIETEVVAETKDGIINCEFELKDEEKTENLLKGIINKPKVKVEIKNEHGDIEIKKRQS